MHPFESFGRQRNWALEHNPFDTEWVLFVDADEVVTPEFKRAVSVATSKASLDVSGFYCCWKMILGDVWLRRSDNFPKWQLRLVRRRQVRFVDAGHGQKEGLPDGSLLFLREPYLHYAFSKGWSAWMERHNRYSTLEASARSAGTASLAKLFSPNPSLRNGMLKLVVSRIPGWPFFRFVYTYIFRGGFLDGSAGFRYCVMISCYEYLIQLKMGERPLAKDGRNQEYARIGHRVF